VFSFAAAHHIHSVGPPPSISWRSELLAYFATRGLSNGAAELIDLLTENSSASEADSTTSMITESAASTLRRSTGTLSRPTEDNGDIVAVDSEQHH
jgi:hypothetical protein